MLPGERKSVEPMAARTAPARTAAQLLHFVGVATWSDEKVLAKVRHMVLPAMERQGPIGAWIIAAKPRMIAKSTSENRVRI
jgi:SRSO17 transposase